MGSNAESRDRWFILILALYLAVAVIESGLFLLLNFRSFPLGVLAILGFTLTYGFFKMKRWAVPLSAMLFFPRLIFGVISFYAYTELLLMFGDFFNVLMLLTIAVYTALTFVTLAYTISKREAFQ